MLNFIWFPVFCSLRPPFPSPFLHICPAVIAKCPPPSPFPLLNPFSPMKNLRRKKKKRKGNRGQRKSLGICLSGRKRPMESCVMEYAKFFFCQGKGHIYHRNSRYLRKNFFLGGRHPSIPIISGDILWNPLSPFNDSKGRRGGQSKSLLFGLPQISHTPSGRAGQAENRPWIRNSTNSTLAIVFPS